MGKYTHVIQNLPVFPPEDQSAQQVVTKIKNEILAKGQSPEDLISDYEDVRFGQMPFDEVDEGYKEAVISLLGKEGLKSLLAEVQKKITAYEQLMIESQDREDEGWGLYGASPTTFKLADGTSVSIQYEPVGKVEDPAAFHQWIIDNDLQGQMTLPWQRREEIVKEKVLAGEPSPDGVKVFSRPKVVFRRR